MKKLLLALLALVGSVQAAELIPPKQTIIVVGGGSDPTKLPLAGGTLTGDLDMSSGTAVNFLAAGSTDVIAGVGIASDTAGGFDISAAAGGFGVSLFKLRATTPNEVVLVFSTSPFINPADVATISWDPASNRFSMNTNGSQPGGVLFQPGHASLVVDGGGASFDAFASSATIGTTTGLNITGPTIIGSALTTNGTVNINAMTTGKALCLNGSQRLSVCTSAVDGSGLCTCN